MVAIRDEWALSERHAIIAREVAKTSGNVARRAGAEYWIAVSRRHQRDPGIEKLRRAEERLALAIEIATDPIDTLRFRSELETLRISFRSHKHVYNGKYGILGEEDEIAPAESYKRIRKIEKDFRATVQWPLGPIEIRLGMQIYVNLCVLWLFSIGMAPGFGAGLVPSEKDGRKNFEALDKICELRHTTIPLNIEFVRLAC